MVVAFFLLACLFLIDCKPKLFVNSFNENYLSKDDTLPIKGIFVILVFFMHYRGYVDLSSHMIDSLYIKLCGMIGQLVVTMFLFYSGYGILTSMKKNRENYIKKFPMHRFLPTYISFAICVTFFLILNLCLGKQYSLKNVLSAYTGWTAIGNSNWYMCVTFILYILLFIAFSCFSKKDLKYSLGLFSALCVILLVVLYKLKISTWWNTFFCFTLGMWYAYLKDKIDLALRNKKTKLICTVALFAVFAVFYILSRKFSILYILNSLFFSLFIVSVTMSVSFGKSKIFSFFGKHVFSIYILQRLVFILFDHLGLSSYNRYLYFVVTFALTIAISVLYDFVFDKSHKKIVCLASKNKEKVSQ